MTVADQDYGITAFGAYVPRLRIARSAIAQAHAWMAPALAGMASGSRAFASWDEDAVTMAVEAARHALGPVGACADGEGIAALELVSNTLPFADLQNAALVAAALQLPERLRTRDSGHSQRAAVSALQAALYARGGDILLVASDTPNARPASAQEMLFGAGAAALRLGPQRVLARVLASQSHTSGFVDHFRDADQKFEYGWEERWVREEGYGKIVPQAVEATLAAARIAAGDCAHFVLAAPGKGIAQAVAKKIGFTGRIAPSLAEEVGHAGVAHPLLMLAAVLEVAKPGETILLAAFGQGCDVLVLQATEALAAYRARRPLAQLLADAVPTSAYLRMLSFAGNIEPEWGMRSEKDGKTALSEQYRSGTQMAGFTAGRCTRCATVQFPQLAYCVNPGCGASASAFAPASLVDAPARVFTYTADWLNFHPAPPLYVGLVQFDNGARVLMEIVDVGEAGIDVGTPLRMVYRIKERDAQRGYRRYFWKATPIQELRE